jgi:hypothetical protein
MTATGFGAITNRRVVVALRHNPSPRGGEDENNLFFIVLAEP